MNSERLFSSTLLYSLFFVFGSIPAPFQVRGELLRERVQRLEAQEGGFAQSLVALQFQKAARVTETLSAYTALLSIQDLLLEELSASEMLTKSACTQILESHSRVSAGAGKERQTELVLSGTYLCIFPCGTGCNPCPVYAAGL